MMWDINLILRWAPWSKNRMTIAYWESCELSWWLVFVHFVLSFVIKNKWESEVCERWKTHEINDALKMKNITRQNNHHHTRKISLNLSPFTHFSSQPTAIQPLLTHTSTRFNGDIIWMYVHALLPPYLNSYLALLLSPHAILYTFRLLCSVWM